MEREEVNLLDYGLVLMKWRWLFIKNFLIVCSITAIISLIVPKWYRATAIVLAPEKSSLESLNISSLVSNLPIGGLGLNLGSSQLTNYLAILKSRTVQEAIIHRFGLQNVYNKKDIEKTLRELENNVDISVGEEGQIIIEVMDKVPQRAASMANMFVALLDSINTQFKISRARYQRILVEKRFEQNTKDLEFAERRLKDFQEKHGVIDIPEQTKAAILGAAELQAQIQLTEVELGVKEKYLRPGHSTIVETRAKLHQLRRKLEEMEKGRLGGSADGTAENSRLFIPFAEVPDLGLQYARLYRDVKAQSTLYEMLFQMYEQAKIQEATDTPTIQVLDRARVPIWKARPKRMIMVLVAGLVSLLLSGFYVFGREYLNRIEHEGGERAKKVNWIKDQISRDVRFWRKTPST